MFRYPFVWCEGSNLKKNLVVKIKNKKWCISQLGIEAIEKSNYIFDAHL